MGPGLYIRHVKTNTERTPVADPNRRDFVKKSLLAMAAAATGIGPLTLAGRTRQGGAPRVAVVGAGVFGGWTALCLLERGAGVTLVDAFGPGDPRASSGGETRVIRGIYGADAVYVDWVIRSFERWRRAERDWNRPLYTQTGALWMFRGDDSYARSSLPLLAERGLPAEELTPAAAKRRFPLIDLAGVRSVFFERQAGFLAARDACRRLVEAFVAAGGDYRTARAEPQAVSNGRLEGIALSDGSTLAADAYVFACGPWLGKLFPDLLGEALRVTRQEVYLFGVPAGAAGFDAGRFPVWIDFGERVFYGVPGNLGRGFKVADDTRGDPADPDTMQRTPGAAGIARARQLLAERFPALADAPVVETRVCQYANSPDGHLLIDRHPAAANVWLAGGGSGHGFKLGPAIGEHVAQRVLGETGPIPRFSLDRFSGGSSPGD